MFDHLSEFYLDRVWGHGGLGEIYPFGKGPGTETTIAQLDLHQGARIEYVYDFGDDIQHIITLEKIIEPEEEVKYPRVVAQNRRRNRYCVTCKEQGKKTVATWVCVECSQEEGRAINLCEACTEKHEDHWLEGILY